MKNKIVFSIIVPVKELNDYLRESVPKILNMNYLNYELIILPNEKPKKVPAYLKNKKIKIIATGKVSPALKRDIGAKKSQGKYLAFIDDDAYPEKNWLEVAEKNFESNKIAAVCGPAVTPPGDSFMQKSSGLFFETLFGGGGLNYRYKPAKNNFYVEDYPSVNFIVEKKAFTSVGGFNNEFWPGEDTKLCLDLTRKGYKILYEKELIVYHHRRTSIFAHLKQVAGYGKHRGYFAKRFPKTSLKIVYFAPSVFLMGNISLAILSMFNAFFLNIWLILLGVYFALVAVDVFIRTWNIPIVIATILLTFFSHLLYGLAFLKGIFSGKFKSELR